MEITDSKRRSFRNVISIYYNYLAKFPFPDTMIILEERETGYRQIHYDRTKLKRQNIFLDLSKNIDLYLSLNKVSRDCEK